ncbi:UDP-N-acetylmuramate--L-alanine ligase [Candidatus Syntrophocurvum alkaliphilum]|uniref:UDP-N-acetylmuramate--L-alanine ligase n=1 Tax=Candidatus Syntrophocurvum alkaliphilum TaxID=2293317 RepID=A0A6I6DBH4_9FIRM|nr:UDP-N-acetylmuramate--L-alanine ligase [Candidatus Syntrophocurvum alkaliphilum]QGT98775.1 UDP-N-acetylmuramate--L-alanine ligase [Candidatus Syntrophocurvum alkaliphilum]
MEEISIFETSQIKHLHFIGIGGISMSGLAQIMLDSNYTVSGSDIKKSDITEKLEKKGIKVYISHSEDNVKEADLVVYTAAVKENNPELLKAKQLKIPTIERSVLLGELSKNYDLNIAVSGTHGKTTTTSMIATILLEASFDPTIHIGGELNLIDGTTKMGGNKYFVTEACEYNEGFVKLDPYIGLILNIENEHPDFFQNIEEIKNTFIKFALQISKNGYLIACIDDYNTASILKELPCNVITYGIKSKNADWTASNIKFNDKGCASFNLVKNNTMITNINLNVPGLHNVSNSLAAISAADVLGCDVEYIKQGLLKFSGANRRLEIKGVINDIKVIDDYAHHPSEIKVTLNAARNFCDSTIWCVFQPHTYSRTKAFLDDFSESFSDADITIVSDIYAAREQDPGDIHSSTLSNKINLVGNKSTYISDFASIVKYLQHNVSPGDVIITMGAGDIYNVGEMFLNNKTN